MSNLVELQKLLGVGSTKVTGTVKSIGDYVLVTTKDGNIQVPKPTFSLRPNDLVVLDGNQIIYGVGQKSKIPVHRV